MDQTQAPSQTPIPASPRRVMAAAAAVMFVAAISQTSVSTALPTMVSDLNGVDYLTWVITGYLMASTASSPVFGKLADLYGRRNILQIALIIFAAGSAIAGLAQDMAQLIFGRVVQGTGGGGLIVVAMTVVADAVPARERGKASGLIGSVFAIATVFGPLMGGFMVEKVNWHWVFFFNLPVAAIAVVAVKRVLPKSPRSKRHVDYMGAALLASLLSATVLFTSLGGKAFDWLSWQSAVCVLGLVIILVIFIAVERRAREPVLPISLFSVNNFIVSNIANLCLGAVLFGIVTFVPMFLQVVKGIQPAMSGLMLLPAMLGLPISSMIAGAVMSRTGRYKFMPIASCFLLTLALCGMAFVDGGTDLILIGALLLGAGLGLGPALSINVSAIQNAIPEGMLGVGTASSATFRLIGGTVGVTIFGAIFRLGIDSRLDLAGGQNSESVLNAQAVAQLPEALRIDVLNAFSEALHPIFFIGAAMAFISFLVFLRLDEVSLSEREPA